jgi:hypothetical protein
MNENVWTLEISKEDYENRKSICLSCSEFKEDTVTCRVCGCPAANFWISETSACPAGKFFAIKPAEETSDIFTEGQSTMAERDVKPALSS